MADEKNKTIEQLAEEVKLLGNQVQLYSDLEEKLSLNNDLRKKEQELLVAQAREVQVQINLILQKKKLDEKLTESEKERLKVLVAEKKEYQEAISLLGQQADAFAGLEARMGLALKKYLNINKEAESLLGSMFESLVAADGFSDALGIVKKQFKETLDPANILKAGLDTMAIKTIELASEQEQVLTNFNKMTGAAGQYNSMIVEMERTNSRFMLSTHDAAAAVESLYVNMNSFSMMNSQVQSNLSLTTAALKKMGISANITAKNIQTANRSLGMTIDESERLQRELLATAKTLAIPPETIAEGFAAAAPKLAQHGKTMISVFKDLAAQSKATGIEISNLIDIASQFDTFDGAAQSAGKLNAILGGDLLNSMDLLMANEADRIKMVQQSIELSGQQWHEMNRFRKMAIANALGIQDMNKAAQLFNPEMIGMTEEQKKAATTMKELEEIIPTVTSMFDELKVVAGRFAVSLQPVIMGIKMVAEGILWLNDKTKGILIPALTVVGSIAYIAFKKASKGAQEGVEMVGKGVGTALKSAASGVKAFGVAAAQGSVGILSFGAGMLLVGAGIAIAALGLSKLADSFAKMTATQILSTSAAFAVLGATLVGLAALIGVASPAFLGAAAAIAALGAAVGIAAAGIYLLVKLNESFINTDFSTVVQGYVSIANAIRGVAESIEAMPLAKTVALAAVTSTAISPAAGTTPINPAAINAAASSGAQQQPQIVIRPNIKLVIDGKELGRVLDGEIKDRIKDREKAISGRAIASVFNA